MKTFEGGVLDNTEERAEQLGVSRQMIRQLLRDGLLQGRKIGNRWYASSETVKAYLTGKDRESSNP
jgi:excisionase family DNA binding protein